MRPGQVLRQHIHISRSHIQATEEILLLYMHLIGMRVVHIGPSVR